MILSLLSIPGADSQSATNNNALIAYLDKVSFLGPALLSVKTMPACVVISWPCV